MTSALGGGLSAASTDGQSVPALDTLHWLAAHVRGVAAIRTRHQSAAGVEPAVPTVA